MTKVPYWGFRTQTSAIGVTGYDGTTNVSNVESWDGSSWTEITEVNSPEGNQSVLVQVILQAL